MKRPPNCGCGCKCNGAWTPSGQACNFCTIAVTNASVKLSSNPMLDLVGGLPIGIPIDGMIESALPLPGGPTDFGPGSGQGIGYFAINSDAVRLHRYAQWSPWEIKGTVPHEGIEDQTFDMSFDDKNTRFIFSDGSNIPNCSFQTGKNISTGKQIILGESMEEFGAKNIEIEFDKVPWSRQVVPYNKVIRKHIFVKHKVTGARYTQADHTPLTFRGSAVWYDPPYLVVDVFYYDEVGIDPYPIKDFPYELTKDGPFYGSSLFGTRKQADEGPIIDPSLNGYRGFGNHVNDAFYRSRFMGNGYIAHQVVERQRRVSESTIIACLLTFSNGNWTYTDYPTITWDGRTIGAYKIAPSTSLREFGTEAIFPITTQPRIGPPVATNYRDDFPAWGRNSDDWELDWGDFDNQDPSLGVYLKMHAVNAPEPRTGGVPATLQGTNWSYPDGTDVTAETIGATDPSLYVGYAGPNWLGRSHQPMWLGKETVIYSLTPRIMDHLASKYEWIGGFDLTQPFGWISNGYNIFSGWNAVNEQMQYVDTIYAGATSPDLASDMRDSTETVEIQIPKANTTEKEERGQDFYNGRHYTWTDIDRYAVSGGPYVWPGIATRLIPQTEEATIIRSCECVCKYRWSYSQITGGTTWFLESNSCPVGTTPTPPSTPGTYYELRNGTCVST